MVGVDGLVKKIKTLREGEGGRSTVRIHIGHGPRGCTATRTAGRRGSAEKPHTLLRALFGRGTAPDALQPVPDALQPNPDAYPTSPGLRGGRRTHRPRTMHSPSASSVEHVFAEHIVSRAPVRE